MADTPDYSWPPMERRKAMGKSIKRLDGPAKSTGRAKYTSDLKPRDMLYAVYVHSPHAHARVTSVDTSDAEKSAGVKAVHVSAPAGTEVQWQGWEIAAVAATTEHAARVAAGRVRVEYEVLPHLVKDDDLSKATGRTKQGGEKVVGDPDETFKNAEVVSEGKYGIPIANHCCLEPHGAVIQWQGDKVYAWPSTQDVTTWATQLSPNIKVDATNIKVKMDYIGGGFGSKFGPDAWGEVAARLSQKAGGRPVKLFLERDAELMIAGNRPPAYGKIRIAGKKDGTITGWQSDTWSTGNMPLPYIIDQIPNMRIKHDTVSINSGPSRAWRAPNNQQLCYLTCSAVDDFAAKVAMDPIEVFKKAVEYAPKARVDLYKYQLDKAAELADWKKQWKPRGAGSGTVKRGLGVAINAWGGAGHNSNCRTTINPDGSVLVEIGTQDLGTGTRTIITQVAAETLGLPMGKVKLVDRLERSAARRGLGRFEHGRRRYGFDAPLQRQRAGQAFRSGGAGSERPTRGPGGRGRAYPRKRQSQQIDHLGGSLQEDRPRQDFGNGQLQSPSTGSRDERPGGGRRADRRCLGRYGDGAGDDQPLHRGAGLRPDRESAAGGEPDLRSDHHGHLDGAVRRAVFRPADRQVSERGHGILQTGGNRGHRRHQSAPGHPAGER